MNNSVIFLFFCGIFLYTCKKRKGGKKLKLQQLLSLTRKAIEDYELIEEGDKIAIGVSGGKDSLVLLTILAQLQKFYPVKFTLCAITVDLGYQDFNLNEIEKLCNQLQIDYYIEKTLISEIVQKHKKPCSLCAKLRKGALNNKAKELGCNKVAFAHHKDDLIETMFLSLCYEGRFHSSSPKTYWENSGLTLIRPLIYISEVDIIGYMNKNPLPIVENPCPYDGHTKRNDIRELVRHINQNIPGCKNRIFRAILDGNFEDWPIPNTKHLKHNEEQ